MLTVLFLILTAFLGFLAFNNVRQGVRFFVVTFCLISPYMKLFVSLQTLFTFIVLLFVVWEWFRSNKFKRELGQNMYNRSIFILCGLLLVTVLLNPDIIRANMGAYVYFITRKIAMLYLGWVAVTSVSTGNKLIKQMVVVSAILLCYGMFEVAVSRNYILDYLRTATDAIDPDGIIVYLVSDRGYRTQTIFYHPYAWGGTILFFVAFLVYMLYNTKSQKRVFQYGILIVFAVINVIYTRGRSTMIPVFLLIILSYMLNSGYSRRKLSLLFPVIIGVFLIPILVPSVMDGLQAYLTFSQSEGGLKGSSTEMRMAQLMAAYEQVKEHFMVGNGFDSLRVFLKEVGKNTDLEGAESIWFIILVDHGFIGVAAYVTFYISIIKTLFGLKRKAKARIINRQINFIILTTICYLLFVTVTGDMNMFQYFLLLLGVTSKYVYLQIKEAGQLAAEPAKPLDPSTEKSISGPVLT